MVMMSIVIDIVMCMRKYDVAAILIPDDDDERAEVGRRGSHDGRDCQFVETGS